MFNKDKYLNLNVAVKRQLLKWVASNSTSAILLALFEIEQPDYKGGRYEGVPFITVTEIANITGVLQPQVSRTLREFVNHDLVERIRDKRGHLCGYALSNNLRSDLIRELIVLLEG